MSHRSKRKTSRWGKFKVHINNLRDKLRKKEETFIAELTKYETVNCRNVHVTKLKEIYALLQGMVKWTKIREQHSK